MPCNIREATPFAIMIYCLFYFGHELGFWFTCMAYDWAIRL